MKRIWRSLVAAVFLTGCYSTVLERRSGPADGRLALGRTLVVADVGEPYRASVEDALARALPGARAAHALPDGRSIVRKVLLAGVEGTTLPSEWESVVLVTVWGTTMRDRVGLGTGEAGLAPPDSEERAGLEAPFGFGYATHDEVAGLDLDVSVRRLADRREIWGVRVRQESATTGMENILELAPDAASRAARELKKARLFE